MTAGNQGPLLEAACGMACSSNSSQICGGPDRLSVFSTGNVTIDTTPTSPPSAGNYTYQGCWVDTAARVLQGAQSNTNDMTVEKCASFCAAAGANAFGVEYSTRKSPPKLVVCTILTIYRMFREYSVDVLPTRY